MAEKSNGTTTTPRRNKRSVAGGRDVSFAIRDGPGIILSGLEQCCARVNFNAIGRLAKREEIDWFVACTLFISKWSKAFASSGPLATSKSSPIHSTNFAEARNLRDTNC